MNKIAIVFGGDSLEHDVSIVTALFTMEACRKGHIPYLPLYIGRTGALYTGKALENKENYKKMKGFKTCHFVFHHGYNQLKIGYHYETIDCALLCVHGANIEDGTAGAFFDLLKIPCTYSGVANASLIQDKEWTKRLLKQIKIPVVPFIVLHRESDLENNAYTFPRIVKPAHLGSSIGVQKVVNMSELKAAVHAAFMYDTKVIVEEVVSNLHELNIAALGDGDSTILSAIEEVNKSDNVLTFTDKYEQFQGKADGREMPANIDDKLVREIKKYTLTTFKKLDCAGVMRFDFLYDGENDKLYLNEINAIPGSLAFYLFEEINMSFVTLVQTLVKLGHKRYQARRRLMTSYNLSSLALIGKKK